MEQRQQEACPFFDTDICLRNTKNSILQTQD